MLKSADCASRAAAAALVTVPMIGMLSGCDTMPSSGAPPTVVCGTTLSKSAAGAVLSDVSRGGRVRFTTIGGNLYLKVSDDCDHGANTEETQRRKDATNPEWPIANVVLHDVTRDQFMARHKQPRPGGVRPGRLDR